MVVADRYVTIRTNLDPAGIIREIKAKLIRAFNQPSSSEHVVIASRIAWNFFHENLKDFNKKSDSQYDRWGVRWKPLAKSTIRRKLGKTARRLSGSQDTYDRGLSTVIRSSLEKKLSTFDRLVPINIDTGRLINSLKPTMNLGNYTPGPGQIATIRRSTLELGTSVPYAKYVQRVRPILPTAEKAAPWIATSLADGLEAIYVQ